MTNDASLDSRRPDTAGDTAQPLATLEVFDVSEFPLVIALNDAIVAGYAPRWERDMNVLVQQDRPFVLLFVSPRPEEPHEDRKHRGLWLKQHKDDLARVCKALITVEPDAQEREASNANAAAMSKAFGMPLEAVATLAEAKERGLRLVAAGD